MARTPIPRLRRVVPAASVALLALGCLAAPAHATVRPATALTISALTCTADGGGTFDCSADVTSGTGTYDYTWTGTDITVVDSLPDAMLGHCQAGLPTQVTLTVSDSTGTAQKSASFTCT
ncbi:hypothetical protein POF50_028795 [Streptomyces sp. SL13]|uniref:Ig-like domain-containing protein n=1 Tax=Streptantibioticus silvisoli TaxID=2705255 RepID=A0AA90H7E1_9ACTN|nr:hypothetical protein [Streptantibioticus silvisoli]MDI5964991.1 hypothetical protein [Streptantibioticus silvisoli]MDI5973296.1 hypothetical protein [Streptantibioticus silvisoli]